VGLTGGKFGAILENLGKSIGDEAVRSPRTVVSCVREITPLLGVGGGRVASLNGPIGGRVGENRRDLPVQVAGPCPAD